jgi:enamine deaminase RidA (YjgF/YER057c/UK114 family)
MSAFSSRLTERGITLPSAPAPVASYVPAVRFADLVQTSGQLPFRDGQLMSAGLVGTDVDIEEGQAAARQCVLNALAAAAHAAGGAEHLVQVLKLTVFVASGPTFDQHPLIANGASDLVVDLFGDAGRHARSAVGVSSLPLGSPVEVEVLVRISG